VGILRHGGPLLVERLGGCPTPTTRQESGGDRHLKFYGDRDNLRYAGAAPAAREVRPGAEPGNRQLDRPIQVSQARLGSRCAARFAWGCVPRASAGTC
jgi:hypothetical protein